MRAVMFNAKHRSRHVSTCMSPEERLKVLPIESRLPAWGIQNLHLILMIACYQALY